MSTVRVGRKVDLDETRTALEEALGGGYEVSVRPDRPGELTVRKRSLIRAPVRLEHSGDGTAFHVLGGGVGMVFRVVNSFGIARQVAGALRRAFPDAT